LRQSSADQDGSGRIEADIPMYGATNKEAANEHLSAVSRSAPGRNRTSDTRFRKPLLYPLSYGGRRSAV
jgi:hypothetical protein